MGEFVLGILSQVFDAFRAWRRRKNSRQLLALSGIVEDCLQSIAAVLVVFRNLLDQEELEYFDASQETIDKIALRLARETEPALEKLITDIDGRLMEYKYTPLQPGEKLALRARAMGASELSPDPSVGDASTMELIVGWTSIVISIVIFPVIFFVAGPLMRREQRRMKKEILTRLKDFAASYRMNMPQRRKEMLYLLIRGGRDRLIDSDVHFVLASSSPLAARMTAFEYKAPAGS